MVSYFVRWVASGVNPEIEQTGVSIHQAESELEILRKVNNWNRQGADRVEKNKGTFFIYYLDGVVDSKEVYY